jgi:hypothetical protein
MPEAPAPPRHAGAPLRCGRAPTAASWPSTRPSPTATISRPPPLLPGFPTLAASRVHPLSTPPARWRRKRRRREGRRGNGGRPRERRSLRRPGPPVGRSRTCCHRARLLPLLPRHRATVFFFLTDKDAPPFLPTPALRPVATEVRTRSPRSSEDAPAFEPGGDAPFALLCRAAATGDAGHRARLGYFSCRCRRLH